MGSLKVALTRDKMKRAGITHILQVLDDFNPYFPQDFRYKVIKILDNKNVNILRYFRTTNRFIQEALDGNGKILVHCFAGKSRSASCVIAYIMQL